MNLIAGLIYTWTYQRDESKLDQQYKNYNGVAAARTACSIFQMFTKPDLRQ